MASHPEQKLGLSKSNLAYGRARECGNEAFTTDAFEAGDAAREKC
jgi:hypothetical protein